MVLFGWMCVWWWGGFGGWFELEVICGRGLIEVEKLFLILIIGIEKLILLFCSILLVVLKDEMVIMGVLVNCMFGEIGRVEIFFDFGVVLDIILFFLLLGDIVEELLELLMFIIGSWGYFVGVYVFMVFCVVILGMIMVGGCWGK